jgi:iron(III) transport system substrate-binding protein
MTPSRRRFAPLAGLALGAFLLTGCVSAPAASPSTAGAGAGAADADYDLDALIEAAGQEGPITVYDGTSKIESMAEAFTEKYGIEATGVKLDAAEAIEKVTREAQAGNIVGDVIAISDLPALKNQLLPNELVYSWVPDDLAADIDPTMLDPLVVITDPSFWTFNTETYDTCPATNVWDLTEPEFAGKVALQDPAGDSGALDWFSQMAASGDDALRDAYEERFGTPLDTDQDSAAAEWMTRFAQNSPILTKSSEEASASVGATGQTGPPLGLISSAKYRNIEEKGYALGVCADLNPWVGMASPKGITIASGSESPNAAKLFVHYALTEEGIAPQINDGKISSNSTVAQPADPANVGEHRDDLFYFDNAGLDADWADRESWLDMWRLAKG